MNTTRRAGTPVLNPPSRQPIPSLEEWESKAPLEEIQTASILKIKKAAEQPPLPLRFSDTDSDAGIQSTSRPSTPLNPLKHQFSLPSSRPATPSKLKQTGLLPKHPILTPQQFYDWYALIERSVAHNQDAHFRAHLSLVANHLDTCDYLVEKVETVEREVEGMLKEWNGVEEGGKNLKESCERVLDERDKLLRLEEELSQRLEYFQELEHATRMLNHPGESLVLQSDFLYMVERVDICIDYLKSHRHFKEAELYLLRFTQCLTRAMILIKMYFVGSLRAMASDITRRLSENKVLSEETTYHLLYTRFLSLSLRQPSSNPNQHSPSSLPPLLRELERRATSHPETLEALLTECHSAYFTIRKAIIGNVVREEVKSLTRGVEMSSSTTTLDIVELTRAGCSYLKQLCTNEFELFREFFATGEDQLYGYLETLCDYLYDDLRPRILHEPRLTALCEVCTVLQALMVLDVDTDAVDDAYSSSPSKGSKLQISHLLQMILQDAQTRLFFKAQSIVQSDIRHYVPSKEDLMYPAKILVDLRSNSDTEKASVSQLWNFKGGQDGSDRDTWYPTLKKTIWVLEQLHDFVNPAIFEDIAEEAIVLCHGSLHTASEMILASASNPSSSSSVPLDVRARISSTLPLDSYLFLLRHLLILKEVPNKFGLGPSETTAGTSSIPSTGSILGPHSSTGVKGFGTRMADSSVTGGVTETLTSLLSFASAGGGKKTIDDTKRLISQSIRLACENAISTSVESVCGPLRTWFDTGNTPTMPSREQVTSALEICASFEEHCQVEVRTAMGKIKVYIGEQDMTVVMSKHLQERIKEEYLEFRHAVLGSKHEEQESSKLEGALLDEVSLKQFFKSMY
ncbi:Sec34-domain-containing protein [Marasmius fiardii PR-910]|nr:Sec34-domain-containing protein [Marasmius fiardii PR-910]